MSGESLWELGVSSIKELEDDFGILASARSEAYGCVFGRDSLITALALLRVYRRTGDEYFLRLVEKILRSLANLQGRFINIESGEEPGKIIHEYRPEKHEHLTRLAEDPWYLYPEGVMRNYDTVDATPLFLIAAHAYLESGDEHFARTLMPSVRAALEWLRTHADHNQDGLIDYELHPERHFGGLRVQSWMDSTESLFYEGRAMVPPYPIAPVEAQAYAWKALRAWGEYFAAAGESEFAGELLARAAELKRLFNERFIVHSGASVSLAFAVDGAGTPLTAARSSMGHVLWASYQSPKMQKLPERTGFSSESILEERYVEPLRRRLLARDLFVPRAGVRTLSSRSPRFDPMSYHNGSIWPHDTAMLAEGLESFGFADDAARVRAALLNAYAHFKTPIELYAYRRGLREYKTQGGHAACRVQAWSAAALLSVLDSSALPG